MVSELVKNDASIVIREIILYQHEKYSINIVDTLNHIINEYDEDILAKIFYTGEDIKYKVFEEAETELYLRIIEKGLSNLSNVYNKYDKMES